METTRRSFLLGSVSLFALAGAGWPLVRSGTIPVDPAGLEAITRAVRAIVSLINQPSLIGLDFCDIDAAVLRDGGRGVCGVREAEGPDIGSQLLLMVRLPAVLALSWALRHPGPSR